MADKIASRIKAQEREIVKLIEESVEASNLTSDWYEKRNTKILPSKPDECSKLDVKVLVRESRKPSGEIIGYNPITIEYRIRYTRIEEHASDCIDVHFSTTKPLLVADTIDRNIINSVDRGLSQLLGYIYTQENGRHFYRKELLI